MEWTFKQELKLQHQCQRNNLKEHWVSPVRVTFSHQCKYLLQPNYLRGTRSQLPSAYLIAPIALASRMLWVSCYHHNLITSIDTRSWHHKFVNTLSSRIAIKLRLPSPLGELSRAMTLFRLRNKHKLHRWVQFMEKIRMISWVGISRADRYTLDQAPSLLSDSLNLSWHRQPWTLLLTIQ